ncbi:hypothetical protein B9Z55_007872 [Caenorhabditis nigoni]|uniref:BTB domain-containing protein n=1 Tax=Caenorhabditis nigoni TaxID=1611254 RepID=A0A2G5VBQ1_9PELO|nr:hypothetical protein B9Z55_007872 [Caenorhabditis nigoni]
MSARREKSRKELRKAKRAANDPSSGPDAKKPMDFSDADSALYDGVVQVEDQKFYINKSHLARHSPFFRTLFFEGFQESKKDVVELKDVTSEAFQLFLELINGQERLTDQNIEGVTQCSSMWQAEVPLRKCLKFIGKSSKLTKKDKLVLADKYDLTTLKNSLFDDVKTVADMEHLLPDMEITNFKPDTITLIAQKLMKINGIHRPKPSKCHAGPSGISFDDLVDRMVEGMFQAGGPVRFPDPVPLG